MSKDENSPPCNADHRHASMEMIMNIERRTEEDAELQACLIKDERWRELIGEEKDAQQLVLPKVKIHLLLTVSALFQQAGGTLESPKPCCSKKV